MMPISLPFSRLTLVALFMLALTEGVCSLPFSSQQESQTELGLVLKATSAEKQGNVMSCNGHASLCNVSYADVVFAGAHNSYAVGDGISDNQNLNVSEALVRGIRLLQAQGHDYPQNVSSNPSGISLCHTSCYLQDGGSLEAWLMQARAWLNVNPFQVLTLLVTNPDRIDLGRWQKGFQYAGFNASNVFTPQQESINRNEWPTLGQLIDSVRRVVAFMDYGANYSQIPWLIDEFSTMWENAYDQLSLPFNCSLDRGTMDGTLSFHNHVKDINIVGISIPDKDNLKYVNAANGSNGVVDTVHRCTTETGVRPTFVLVDFFDEPSTNNVLTGVDQLNNVSNTALTKFGRNAASPALSLPGRERKTASWTTVMAAAWWIYQIYLGV